ncbi:hypothetical protein K440DRAFT_616542 [Wilcoxina mikolae CBS 423.85]|nr:hypothetical protein K440DRAFT_616542 [Wilcoxina mikolae CBS 423.85]
MSTTPRGPTSETSSLRSSSPDTRPGLHVSRSFSRLESIDGSEDPLASSIARLKGGPTVQEIPEVSDNEDEDEDGNPLSAALLPEGFDDLPPELISLADRFINSLTKPIHPAPLTVTQLSEMFQQFYGTATQAISKHVTNSFLSLSSKKPSPRTPTTQMLSKAEMVQKKRDRKLLEVKQIALEEGMEKYVTESLYDKLWRHKSTDDEARDESLQSKIAALKVVGVNMGHLGVELDSAEKVKEVDHELEDAFKALAAMNEKKYPLGKLTLLKAAHKTIVDCLTRHISSTSADCLLPTLIYALILSPPEPPLNAISNLYFIQRFRASNFIDGEAAYCLTNYEAAVSFLETVDLASLKISDTDEPSSTSPPLAPPRFDDPLSKPHTAPAATTTTTILGRNASAQSSTTSLLHPGTPRGRTLSYLTPIDIATTAATTAVSTADQGIRGIGVALESSYKFLFDRRGDNVPKTLEDARKLVESPTNPAIKGVMQRRDSDLGSEKSTSIRDPSPVPAPLPSPAARSPAAAAAAGLEPLKHIGSSIGRFANIGMRGFGRSSSAAATPTTTVTAPPKEDAHVKDLLETFPDLAKEMPGPVEKLEYRVNARFAGLQDAGELRIADVEVLLQEYRGLVGELKKKGLVD